MAVFSGLAYFMIAVTTCSQHTRVFAAQFENRDQAYFRNLPCPNPEDIAPCICTYQEDVGVMDLNCTTIADEQELDRIFHSEIPIPKFRNLALGANNLAKLTDTVFGDATFTDVRTLSGGTLTSVGSKTFMKSASTLRVLYLHNNNLSEFPYETLSQYTNLQYFSLNHNPVSYFPIIESASLRVLYLSNAAYNTIPTGALDGMPKLEYFNGANTGIHTMATEIFKTHPKMRTIYMYNMGLTHLESQQFGVSNSTINIIDLHRNQIATVDADAFKGVHSGTINMKDNQLTNLPESTWGTLINAGVHLQLQGNELECGCDVAWLVLEPLYHSLVADAVCHSGELLVDLDPKIYDLC